ncbi:hypothetical protein FI667_g10183, partial [Globisporangium splendens]
MRFIWTLVIRDTIPVFDTAVLTKPGVVLKKSARMWSKFTEYAEGIVEKVAQADAAAAAAAAGPNGPASSSSSSPPLSTSSISGEEIWSRFTSIVAPPAASSAGKDAQDGEDEGGSDRDEYDGAALSAKRGAGVPRQQQQPSSSTTVKTIDEDEQEQYICELERALLQRKKQHEVLEKKVYELEYHHAQETQRFKLQLQEKEKVIADQTRRIESAVAQPLADEHDAAATKQVVEKVELLEQRLRGLMVRCSAVEASRDLMRAAQSNLPAIVQEYDTLAASGLATARIEDEKTLQQVAKLLSKMVESSSESVHREPADGITATHILALATQAQADFEKSAARAAVLEHAIGSFLGRHGVPGGHGVDPSTIVTCLDAISDKIMKSAAAAAEVDRLQAKIHLLEDKEEEQLKKILHLQAQANSMHANLQKTDQSLQQTASKEADLLDQMNEKDATIQRLQANVTQVKASMEHLASELKEAQSYTDELEGYCRQQKQKIASQREQLKELDQVKSAYDTLQEQEREMRAQAAEYEQGYVGLLAEMEALKAQNEEESKLLVATTEAHAMSTENQTIYDLESRLSASEADKQVALQDAARLQQNVDALEGVLHQFQVDQKQQRERLLGLELALEKAQDTIREQQQHLQSKTKSKEGEGEAGASSDLQRVMDVLAKKNLECEQLREVTYFETDRKGDVLQLIARMMGFSEDQKRRVGLGFPVEGNGGGGLFSSILGFVAPPSGDQRQQGGERANASDVTIDGKSFADIWTEFLLEEAKNLRAICGRYLPRCVVYRAVVLSLTRALTQNCSVSILHVDVHQPSLPMDAAYSLRSSRNDSFGSTDSFTVVAFGDALGPWDGGDDIQGMSDEDEWEQLSAKSSNNDDEAVVTRVLGTSQLYEHYAVVDKDARGEPECELDDEPVPFITLMPVKAPTVLQASESQEMESRSTCTDAHAVVEVHTAVSRPPLMSPASRSRKAKEALRAFYLSRAKQMEEKRKLLAVHASPAVTQPSSPRPRAVILPLKAPVRYSVAVREQVLQLENAQRARIALQQFYLAREVEKQKRAARNRDCATVFVNVLSKNEAYLLQSQSGQGALRFSERPIAL